MRPASHLLNIGAAAILIGLAAASVVLVIRIGPLGLLLLGMATVLVCSLATLNEDVPTWGTNVFRARMQPGTSPEERAARAAERAVTFGSLRFYRRCGAGLAAAGALALAWQGWR